MKKTAQVLFLLLVTVFCSSKIFAYSNFIKYQNNPIYSPSPLSWDSFSLQDPVVIKSPTGFKMWYEGNAGQGWRIGHAYSQDGISNWIRSSQPVIDLGSIDGLEKTNESPYVIYNADLHLYQMWYTSVPTSWQGGPDRFRLRYATSPDGVNWTRYNDYVLRGSSGNWDSGGIARGESIIYNNGLYQMWYSGTDWGFNWKIGYATSTDGINWHKENNGNPVISPSESWEQTDVNYPKVKYVNNQYEMFYTSAPSDAPNQIIYATSTDGINWNKEYSNPVLTGTPSTFDSNILSSPSPVLLDNGTTLLYYSGNAWAIGVATDGPLPTPTPIATATPTSTPTPTATATLTPTPTPPPVSNKVIVVPGVLGSWNASIPDCTVEPFTDLWTSHYLGEFVYAPIVLQLAAIGKTPVPYYYDWRHTAEDNVTRFSQFLENTATSPTEAFDVIAHSFGGLVSQAYLENVKSHGATNRIHSLVTVGTPFQGAVKAYSPWARGVVWKDDDMFFKAAMNLLIKYCATKKYKDQKTIVHKLFPSIGNLQPRFPYLNRYDLNTILDPESMTTRNTWNRDTTFSDTYYGTNVHTISGIGQPTLEEALAKQATTPDLSHEWWLDGKPSKYNFTYDGDHTVRRIDSLLPNSTPNTTVTKDHQGIINSIEGISAIFSSLDYAPPVLTLQTPQQATSTLVVMSNHTTTQITDPARQIKKDTSGLMGYVNPKPGIYSIVTTQTGNAEGSVVVLQELSNGDSYQKEYIVPKNSKKIININFDGISQFK